MEYEGSERRIHKVVVTRNTEYHFKRDVCVAVRDRRTKRWCEGHMAVSLRLEGGVKFHDNGSIVPTLDGPRTGDAIFFTYKTDWGEDRQLITSKIEDVARPPKKDVLAYATLKKKPALSA